MKKAYFFFDGRWFRIWLSDSPGDVFDAVKPPELTNKLKEYEAKGYQLTAGEPEE